jgi:SpoIIAA-like
MINLQLQDNTIYVTVLGEFTLADYKEFEEAVFYGVRFKGKVKLLMDLRDMLSYTVDVAWEELKFARQHANDFEKIAVITDDQWVTWSVWLNRLFVNADMRIAADDSEAEAWLAGEAVQPRVGEEGV